MKQNLFILFILSLVVACVTPKKVMRSSYVDSLDNLLSTPTLNPTQELVYRKYTENRKDYVLDTFSVQTRTYNYNGIDSILQLMTLHPDAWSVQQLEEVYGRFEMNFFRQYSDYLDIRKMIRHQDPNRSILNEEIDLLRNIDYLIYAKKRYAKKGYKKSAKLFKNECQIIRQYRLRRGFTHIVESAYSDLQRIDFFTSKKYLHYVKELVIPLRCGKYTMMDRFVKKNSKEILEESLLAWSNKELIEDISNAYLLEYNSKTFHQDWNLLLDEKFDQYLYSLVSDSLVYNKVSVELILKRGNKDSVLNLYTFDTEVGDEKFEHIYFYKKPFEYYLSTKNESSVNFVKQLLISDLQNYCYLDSVKRKNIWLLTKLEWNDKQIDSLIQIRETQPCDDYK